MAISFMSCVRRVGWNIPDCLSVVSFDGSPVCEYSAPPLSTIEQPVEEMGQAAVALLIERIEQTDIRTAARIVVPSRLIRRESMSAAKPGLNTI